MKFYISNRLLAHQVFGFSLFRPVILVLNTRLHDDLQFSCIYAYIYFYIYSPAFMISTRFNFITYVLIEPLVNTISSL